MVLAAKREDRDLFANVAQLEGTCSEKAAVCCEVNHDRQLLYKTLNICFPLGWLVGESGWWAARVPGPRPAAWATFKARQRHTSTENANFDGFQLSGIFTYPDRPKSQAVRITE